MTHICVDFDGVIADTSIAKKEWIELNLGIRIGDSSCDRSTLFSLIGPSNYHSMQNEIGHKDTLNAPPMPGAYFALNQLSKSSKIVIVSARPPEKIAWIQHWLDMNKLSRKISDIISSSSIRKSDVVRKLQAKWLIDDDQRHHAGLPEFAKFMRFGKHSTSAIPTVISAPDWVSATTIILKDERLKNHPW